MEAFGSLVIASARAASVPAGGALAMDRDRFADRVGEHLAAEPRIEIRRGEVTALPEGEAVLATGPLTSPAMAAALRGLLGDDYLYFYDAIAPIVEADSLDYGPLFWQSRYGKGDGDDYLNVPLDREGYLAFHRLLTEAEVLPLHDFEKEMFFEGCLPIEELARRGVDTLRFGCMKPVGLTGPDGRRPYAVVQLRREDLAKSQLNMVGFQSRMKWPEQRRVFATLPGFAAAEFARLGQIHRNTFVNAPTHLDAFYRVKERPALRLAGQITGVEGYLESAATGLAIALYVALERAGAAPRAAAAGDRARRPRPPPDGVRPAPLPAGQHQLRPVPGPRAAGAQGRAPRRLRRARPPCARRLGGRAPPGDRRRPLSPPPACRDRRPAPASGRLTRRSRAAVRRLVDRFLEHLAEERNYSPHTVRAYRGDLDRFVAFLAEDFLAKPAAEIRPADVEPLAVRSFLAALHRDGSGRRSQGRALSAVRSLFRFACREGIVAANPAAGVPTPKAPRELPRHLRPGEVEDLVEAPGEEARDDAASALRDRALLELLYATGLRVSEAVSLDWRDLDLAARVLRVVGKGGKERMVPFGRQAAAALTAWLGAWDEVRARDEAADPEAEPVFLHHRGGRLSDRSVRRVLDRYVDRAALAAGVHPHTLRHTFATHLLGGRRRPARHPGAARPQLAGDDAALHARRDRAPAPACTGRRTRGRRRAAERPAGGSSIGV